MGSRVFLCIFLFLIGSISFAKGPPSLQELREQHQAAVGAIATIHIRLKALYDPPNLFGDEEVELWRDGGDFRHIYQSSKGRKIETQGISGTLKSFVNNPPINKDTLHSKSGIIGPVRRSLFADPSNYCLLKVPSKGSMDWLPLADVLNEPHNIKNLRNFTEKGKEYSIITLDFSHGKFEAWLSKNHNYLVERLLLWPDEGGANPGADMKVMEFKEILPGIHFPTKILTQFYSIPDGQPKELKSVTVEKLDINRPILKSQLEFRFPPGEIVLDRNQNKIWRTDANGQIGVEAKNGDGTPMTLVKGGLQPALEKAKGGPTLEEPKPITAWLLSISLLLIISGIFLLLFKKLKTQPVK